MSAAPVGRIPQMVWIGGRGVWHEGPALFYREDMRHRYPPVLCEVCNEPATGTTFEEIDVTQSDDEVCCALPGRPHHFCRKHHLEDLPAKEVQ